MKTTVRAAVGLAAGNVMCDPHPQKAGRFGLEYYPIWRLLCGSRSGTLLECKRSHQLSPKGRETDLDLHKFEGKTGRRFARGEDGGVLVFLNCEFLNCSLVGILHSAAKI